MEYEMRFYFSMAKKEEIIEMLKTKKDLNMGLRTYEKTVQYDHPSEENSFYSKEIDGRFRVRVSNNEKESVSKISWKRRLPIINSEKVNKEEEVEVEFKYCELGNLEFLLNNILKMKNIESYERYRTTFYNDDVEIALDEYPFGLALEIENKSSKIDPQENVLNWVNIIGLKPEDSFKLSWDDKYTELCKEQGVEIYNNVSFELPMPSVK